MKSHLKIGFATVILLLVFLVGQLFSQSATANINVVVNGAKLQLKQPPIMQNSTVLVPLRGVFESLGVTVFYDGDIHCITKDKTIYLTNRGMYSSTGEYCLFVDNVEVEIYQQPPINYKGNMMVPVRVISEALGAKVGWNNKTNTVTIDANINPAFALTAAEVEKCEAFTLQQARKAAENNTIYKYYERNREFWYSYASYKNGVKSQNIGCFDEKTGSIDIIQICISGEISVENYYTIDESGDPDATVMKYKLAPHAAYLPFQEKYDGLLGGVAYVGTNEAGASQFKKEYFSKAPTSLLTETSITKVNHDGDELYYIFPKYEGTNIVIRAVTVDKNYNTIYGKTLYSGLGPVLLRANISDLWANTEITLTFKNDTITFSPHISLMDGSVDGLPYHNVLDLTL